MATPRNGATNYNVVQFDGQAGLVGTESVTALMCDTNGDVLFCTGLTVPSNAQTGFSKSAIFIDTDVASGTGSMYLNKGTKTSCIFTLVTQG